MDHPDDQKTQGASPSAQKPPPYDICDPIGGPAPTTTGFVAYSSLQYQPHSSSQGASPGQEFIFQQPQPIALVVPVQPTHEQDYMSYAIFTTVCCFLPLGVVALVYSIKTREANRIGDGTAAQQGSKMARYFSHAAVGVGIMLVMAYIALFVLHANIKKPSY